MVNWWWFIVKESDLQKQCITWFRMQYPRYCWKFVNEKKQVTKCSWLKASLNGINLAGGKNAGLAIKRLKEQGMCVGESDLELPIPNKYFNGLFIELKLPADKIKKTKAGRQQKSQVAFEEQALLIGWNYVICRTLEEVKTAVDGHLSEIN
jgi:hypothetical protein